MKIFLFLLVINNLFAQNNPKTYTEEEFKKRLDQEIAKKISRLKGPGLISYANELLSKEKELEIRERKLNDKQTQLNVSMEKFEKRVQELLGKQNNLIGCFDTAKGDEDKRISHMVEIISAMKADKAAQVLAVQDPEITIKILGLLDSKKVSRLFNLMDKEISARLQKQFMTMKR